MFAIKSITNSPFINKNKLNILTFVTHEAAETNLCKSGHNFFAFRGENIKSWCTTYRKVPPNYYILGEIKNIEDFPVEIDFDLVLSHQKFGQFQIASQIAEKLKLPLVNVEHTFPLPSWRKEDIQNLRELNADINIFITRYNQKGWGYSDTNSLVIEHGIDTELFKPNPEIKKKNHILSIVNDWIGRDIPCGYRFWKEVTEGLPVHPIGHTVGLSKPAKDLDDLIYEMQSSRIFINTSQISPIPLSLLETMSCGTAIVTTATCEIPTIIKNGENGFITNDKKEIRQYLELLLKDEKLAEKLGNAARQTIIERFGLNRFLKDWAKIFEKAISLR